jgi:hypothetical protein
MTFASSTPHDRMPGMPEDQVRVFSTTAGTALPVMAILAGFAHFGVLDRLVVDDDAAETRVATRPRRKEHRWRRRACRDGSTR